MNFLSLEVPAHVMKLEKSGSTFFIKSNFILNQWNNIPVVRTQKRERVPESFWQVYMIS